MWGTLPGKNHSDYLQRPITSARSPFSFSTLPKYTPDLAGNTSPSCPSPDLAGNTSPSCQSPDLAGNTSPSCQSPDLAGNIFSFLPVARPCRKHIAFLPVARPRRKHLLLLAGHPTSPVPPTRSWPPPFSFPGVGPTFSGSHRGSGRRFWPIVEQTSSLSGLCRGSDGPSAPRTVLTVPP